MYPAIITIAPALYTENYEQWSVGITWNVHGRQLYCSSLVACPDEVFSKDWLAKSGEAVVRFLEREAPQSIAAE